MGEKIWVSLVNAVKNGYEKASLVLTSVVKVTCPVRASNLTSVSVKVIETDAEEENKFQKI